MSTMSEVSLESIRPTVEQEGKGYRVNWPDNTSSWFHNYWLRENCHCPKCTHQSAWERIIDVLAVPEDISPARLMAEEDGIHIVWPVHPAPCEGTFFSWQWLWDHRTETEARVSRKPSHSNWRGADIKMDEVTFQYDAMMSSDEGLLAVLECMEEKGFTIIDNMPDTHEAVIDIAERITFIEESHFGRDFEVESKPNPENLAYTAHALMPHNDLPSRKHLPGVQFLHCRINEANGGDSILVNSIAIAERLKEEDPEAFDILSSTPVRFNSIGDNWHIINRNPVIQLDEDGDVIGTRIHPALFGPADVAPEQIDAFYRAHRKILKLCVAEDMQLRFRLTPGKCQIFNNYRILHARDQFDPNSGARHLHGVYINLDDMESRLEVLRRRGVDFRHR